MAKQIKKCFLFTPKEFPLLPVFCPWWQVCRPVLSYIHRLLAEKLSAAFWEYFKSVNSIHDLRIVTFRCIGTESWIFGCPYNQLNNDRPEPHCTLARNKPRQSQNKYLCRYESTGTQRIYLAEKKSQATSYLSDPWFWTERNDSIKKSRETEHVWCDVNNGNEECGRAAHLLASHCRVGIGLGRWGAGCSDCLPAPLPSLLKTQQIRKNHFCVVHKIYTFCDYSVITKRNTKGELSIKIVRKNKNVNLTQKIDSHPS